MNTLYMHNAKKSIYCKSKNICGVFFRIGHTKTLLQTLTAHLLQLGHQIGGD